MNKRDFCYGALNQILVMTDYLEDKKSNSAGFVKYQTIKELKAIRCYRNPWVFFKYREKGKESFFTSVARNNYLTNKAEVRLVYPSPLCALLPVFEATRKGKKSKEGFVVNTWESNSVGPPAQKAAHRSIKKINGGYFRWPFVEEEGKKSRSQKNWESVETDMEEYTHRKKSEPSIVFATPRNTQSGNPFFSLPSASRLFSRARWFSRTIALAWGKYRTTRRLSKTQPRL